MRSSCPAVPENDLHLLAQIVQLFLVNLGNVLAVEEDLTACALKKVDDGAAQSGLAASGFTDDAHSSALGDLEAYVVHCVEFAVGGVKIFHEVFGLNHRYILHCI